MKRKYIFSPSVQSFSIRNVNFTINGLHLIKKISETDAVHSYDFSFILLLIDHLPDSVCSLIENLIYVLLQKNAFSSSDYLKIISHFKKSKTIIGVSIGKLDLKVITQ